MLKCHNSTREKHRYRGELKVNFEEESEFSEVHYGPCGIWRMASYANHCCDFNAQHSFMGDIMIIRASKDLDSGTEVTISYRERANDYDQTNYYEQRGFCCTCDICQEIASTEHAALKRRAELVEETRQLVKKPNEADVQQIKVNMDALSDTYRKSAAKIARLSMFEFQFIITQAFIGGGLPQNAVESVLKCLDFLGFVITGADISSDGPMVIKKWGMLDYRLVECWISMSRAYRTLASLPAYGIRLLVSQREREAMTFAKLFYKICVGEDETFHPALLPPFGG